MLDDLNSVIHDQRFKFYIIKVVVFFTFDCFGFFPPTFDDTVLLQQCVREPVVQNLPSVVLLLQYVVYVVCSLFGCGYIIGVSGLELYQLITRGEHAHQGGLDPLNRILYCGVYVM